MKRIIKNNRGSAVIGAAFMILILCTLIFVICSGVTVYANYQTAENELQRALTVTVDQCMENATVRDLELDLPAGLLTELLKENMIRAGWILEDNNWIKKDGEKRVYCLDSVEIKTEDQSMRLEGMFVMPIPWVIGEITEVRIPMQARVSVLYIDL
jgi:hypothetical protein